MPVELSIVCWNVKQFGPGKADHSQIGPDLAAMFNGLDAGIILEAPANLEVAVAAAATLATRAGLAGHAAAGCGGMGNEEESIVVVRDAAVAVVMTRLVGTWDGSIRSPVLIALTKGGLQCKIVAWHAPPPGGDNDMRRATAWPQVQRAAQMAGADFIMGDFNAELTAPRRSGWACVSEASVKGTTLNNPNNVRVDSLRDIITDSKYDRVYRHEESSWRVDLVAILISKYPTLALPPRGAQALAEMADPRRAYAMSDHLPVILRTSRG